MVHVGSKKEDDVALVRREAHAAAVTSDGQSNVSLARLAILQHQQITASCFYESCDTQNAEGSRNTESDVCEYEWRCDACGSWSGAWAAEVEDSDASR